MLSKLINELSHTFAEKKRFNWTVECEGRGVKREGVLKYHREVLVLNQAVTL